MLVRLIRIREVVLYREAIQCSFVLPTEPGELVYYIRPAWLDASVFAIE